MSCLRVRPASVRRSGKEARAGPGADAGKPHPRGRRTVCQRGDSLSCVLIWGAMPCPGSEIRAALTRDHDGGPATSPGAALDAIEGAAP